MSRKRALIAGVFSLVYPGLGHVYLREWFRAIGWFSVALATAILVIPESAVTAYETGGISALFEASAELSSGAIMALFAIRMLNIVDAVWIGLREDPRRSGEEQPEACPHCGGELDEDLAFCPWCTTRLDTDGAPDANEAGAPQNGVR